MGLFGAAPPHQRDGAVIQDSASETTKPLSPCINMAHGRRGAARNPPIGKRPSHRRKCVSIKEPRSGSRTLDKPWTPSRRPLALHRGDAASLSVPCLRVSQHSSLQVPAAPPIVPCDSDARLGFLPLVWHRKRMRKCAQGARGTYPPGPHRRPPGAGPPPTAANRNWTPAGAAAQARAFIPARNADSTCAGALQPDWGLRAAPTTGAESAAPPVTAERMMHPKGAEPQPKPRLLSPQQAGQPTAKTRLLDALPTERRPLREHNANRPPELWQGHR